MVDAALVVGHAPHGAHLAREVAASDRLGAHAHALDEGGIDLDAFSGGRCPLAGADGHEVHAHRTLAGLVADVGGVHGRLPVEGVGASRTGTVAAGRGRGCGGVGTCPRTHPPAAARCCEGGDRDQRDPVSGPHRSDAPRLASTAAKAARRSAIARSSRSCALRRLTWVSIKLRKSTLSTS